MAPARLAVGVDVGGTKISGAVVSEDGRVGTEHTERTPAGDSSTVLGTVRVLVARLLADAGDPVAGIGLAVAGTVDYDRGVVVVSPNLPFRDELLKSWCATQFSLRCVVDNDGNLAALGESRFGAARGVAHAICITLGTGIGSGIIINGDVYRGATGSAGELGHMILDAAGPKCTCGSRGCFEALAAGPALARRAWEALRRRPDSTLGEIAARGDLSAEAVIEAARKGDEVAVDAVEQTAYWLGVGLTNIVNIFNPEVIVVGGGMAEAGNLLLMPAEKWMRALAIGPNSEVVRVLLSGLGNRAGVLGAAALVFGEVR